ncbi:hypothetical protein BDW71DRAFT_3030 [Aspergillus fruticulosus]
MKTQQILRTLEGRKRDHLSEKCIEQFVRGRTLTSYAHSSWTGRYLPNGHRSFYVASDIPLIHREIRFWIASQDNQEQCRVTRIRVLQFRRPSSIWQREVSVQSSSKSRDYLSTILPSDWRHRRRSKQEGTTLVDKLSTSSIPMCSPARPLCNRAGDKIHF